MVVVVGSIYGDVDNLLPHFLKHYAQWGVDAFHFGVYQGKDNPSWNRTLDIGKGYPINLHHWGGKELNVEEEGEFKNTIRRQLGSSDWYIPVDLDEFHKVPNLNKSVYILADALNAEGAEYVSSTFADRITADGSIPMTIDPNISIWDQFPYTCRISDTIVQAWCDKVSFAKPHVECMGGHHAPGGPDGKTKYKKFSLRGRTFHFKWFGPLYEKEKMKFDTYTSQGRPWVREQSLLLEWLDTHNGKLL